MIKNKPESIKEYIQREKPDVQKRLKKVLTTIKRAAPKAKEKIAWGMPTLELEGNLITFAAWKNHLSIFPGAGVIEKFKKDLIGFETSRGTIRFPYDEEIPTALLTKIVKFCVKRNLLKAKSKKSKI